MNRRSFIVSILAVGCFIATSMLIPSVGIAQMDKVKALHGGFDSQDREVGSAQDRRD